MLKDKDTIIAGSYALRHYVSLSYYVRSPEILESRGIAAISVCSGFIMQARGHWCLVTAGHVLDLIDEEREDGKEVDTFRLWDGWKFGSLYSNYIPFDFDGAETIRVYKEDEGLDYGLIVLRPLFVSSLAANGIVPVGEEQYERDWPSEFHAYAMIGCPSKTVSLQKHGENSTLLNHSAVVVSIAEERDPPLVLLKPHPRLYGKILVDEGDPQWEAMGADISGMSGGPVIGIRREGEHLRYWVVGVQSGWEKTRRVIAACPFQKFARLVGAVMDEVEGAS